MISIPQYGSFFSLYISLIAIVPCIIIGLLGRKSKLLNLIVSLVMIFSILGFHTLKLFEFTVFIIYETILVYFYFYFRKKSNNEIVYRLVFLLTILPLFMVRIVSLSDTYASYFGFTGISYICFKLWQIIMETHDGKITVLPILDYFGLLLFFPSFSSGPIARYEAFKLESEKVCKGKEYFDVYIKTGVEKIVRGLFYKFALAYAINELWMSRVPDHVNLLNIISYMYSYTLYLFFDFAGYSAIAIGVASLMGIKLPENFNKPFLARNMKEFWTRWHMSLSSWFGDYVSGRFVLNNVRNGLFKSPKKAFRWGVLFTMTIMGLWHGFEIHYIIYGVYQGILLVITDIYIKSKYYRTFRKKPYYDILSRVICFQFISIGMLLFSGHFINI